MSEPFFVRRWEISRDERDVTLRLTSPQGTYDAVKLDAVVPDGVVLQWLVDNGEPCVGDEIITSTPDMLRWGGERLRIVWVILPDGRQVFDCQIARA